METAYDQPGTAGAERHQPCKKRVRSQTCDLILTTFQSFNVVAQHDSHVLKNDSKSMKAIAIVTVAFLPLATIAVRDHPFPKGLENTNKGRADAQRRKILVANDFWIFWALLAPFSLAISFVYYYLCYFRGPKQEPLPKVIKQKRLVSP